MQLFRAQLSRYIPHPHRDSWMRNNLEEWLQLLRIGSFLTLLAAAWNITRTCSPLAIPDQYLPLLEQTTSSFFKESSNGKFSLADLQNYLKYSVAAFFLIAALSCLRCGTTEKKKYILPVFIAGTLLIISAVKHCSDSDYEIISIISFLLPISTPFLLLGYKGLANKIDHWNYYASFFCITTIFGNALNFLFNPNKTPHFEQSTFTSFGLPSASGEIALAAFSYTAIFFALLTIFATTRRLSLFVLISIGVLTCVYRILVLSLSCSKSLCFDLIIADSFFHTSYWLIPLLILMSLASRRNTQTLKL